MADGRKTFFEEMLDGVLAILAYLISMGLLILIVWAAIAFPGFGGFLVCVVAGVLFYAIFIYRDPVG